MQNRREVWIVIGIILLALFFRWYNLDLTPLGNDIARDLLIAGEMLDTGVPYFGGVQASLGNPTQATFGPLEYYLLLLPLSLSRSPAVAAGLVGLLSALAVVMCYLLCRRFVSQRVAILASLLYAVNPWVLFYGRFVWNPNFVPLFAVLFVYCICKVRIDKKPLFLLGAGAALGALVQFHMITLFLAPLLLLTVSKKNMSYLIGGAAMFVLLLSPFFINSVVQGSSVLEPITGFAAKRTQGNPWMINVRDALAVPVMLATNYYGPYMFGADELSSAWIINRVLDGAVVLAVVLLLAGIVVLAKRYWEKREDIVLILLLWFVLPIIGFLLLNKNISPHYGQMLFPVQFIVMASLVEHVRKKWRKALVVALLVLVVAQAFFSLGFFHYVDVHGGTTAAYGIPYTFKYAAAEFIVRDAQGKDLVVVYLEHEKPEMQYVFTKVLGASPQFLSVSLSEAQRLQDGYLVVDKLSMYGWAERALSEEEKNVLNAAEQRFKFGGLEVIKLPMESQ